MEGSNEQGDTGSCWMPPHAVATEVFVVWNALHNIQANLLRVVDPEVPKDHRDRIVVCIADLDNYKMRLMRVYDQIIKRGVP